jgi:hypothetical protein
MKRMPRTLPAILALAALALGCSNQKVYRLSDEPLPKAVPAENVRLFLGETTRPHRELALVNSVIERDKTTATKRRQLADLQGRAAGLGADAVVDIRLLSEKHRGFTLDPTVPFRAWQQGHYELYFLRGRAIQFIEQPEESGPEWEEVQAGLATTAEDAPSTPALQGIDVDTIPEEVNRAFVDPPVEYHDHEHGY